jgi:hypothetical protein
VPNDYILNGDIEEIEERTTGDGCEAHLALRVLLLRTGAGAGDPIVLRWEHAEAEPCTCNDPLALAAAMSKALERISTQLQQGVYDAVANDQA